MVIPSVNSRSLGFLTPTKASTSTTPNSDSPRSKVQVNVALKTRQTTLNFLSGKRQGDPSAVPKPSSLDRLSATMKTGFNTSQGSPDRHTRTLQDRNRFGTSTTVPTQSQSDIAKNNKVIVIDEDEDEDDDNIVRRAKKRRIRQHHLDSDSEGEMQQTSHNKRVVRRADEDSDDDPDHSYMDENDKEAAQLNVISSGNKLALLCERFPKIPRVTVQQTLFEECSGIMSMAAARLASREWTTQASSMAMEKQTQLQHRQKAKGHLQYGEQHGQEWQRQRQRQLNRRSIYISDDSDDSEDDRSGNGGELLRMKQLREASQTVAFFNKASSQEIMDVTGCKLTHAQKLSTLRPFDNLENLTDKLKQERGLSVKFIKAYQDLMDGYSAVDQIIQNIEDLGGRLESILDVWQKLGSVSEANGKTKGDNEQDSQDGVDEDAGLHLVNMAANNVKGLDTENKVYKDAMTGFLTDQPAIVNPDFKLKSYQIIGVNWMLLLYRKGISGILADEMGLGKTAQVIAFLGRLYELGESGPHLIVVPSSTMDNWLREFERFCPSLNVRCYYGSQNERTELQEDILDELDDIHALVTTYNIATGRQEDRSFLRKLKCKSMILDEGHMIKNYTSARYKALMQLKVPFRLLLTGTPLQNNLQELVSLLIFIMPKVFTGNEEDVRKIFKIKQHRGDTKTDSPCSSSETASANKPTAEVNVNAAQMLSRQRIQRAKKMMTPFVLRRRKLHVLKHLPKKFHHVNYCPMTPNQQAIYTKIISESQERYKDVVMDQNDDMDLTQQSDNNINNDGKKNVEKFSNIIMHLRKAADHPLLFRHIYSDDIIRKMAKTIMTEEQYWDADEEYIYEDMQVMTDFELNRLCNDHRSIRKYMLQNEEWMDAGKVRYLQKLLPEMKRNGNKILLFSQFTSMLDILEPVMKTLNMTYLRLDGSTKVGDRQLLIDEFNQDDSLDVFLLSTKAGGFGINLTSANVVIMYDMDFNPQNDRQAEDRAHRVGQTRDVTVHKLLSEHTIEHQILAMADIRLRLDKTICSTDQLASKIYSDGDHQDSKHNDGNEDDPGIDQAKIRSLLKSALLSA